MVVYSETLILTFMRVFKWNEKLREGVASEGEGLFVFRAKEGLETYIPGAGYMMALMKESEKRKRVVGFEVWRLTSREWIERLSGDMIEASGLFGSRSLQGFQSLERQLSDALTAYYLDGVDHRSRLLISPIPITVIFVGFERCEECRYSVDDYGPYPPIPMLFQPTPFAMPLHQDQDQPQFSAEEEVNTYCMEGIHCGAGYELMCILKSSWWLGLAGIGKGTGGIGNYPMQPIVSDEALGLVDVGGYDDIPCKPKSRITTICDGDGLPNHDDVCSICLADYTVVGRRQEIAILGCSHVFHKACIAIWLWSMNRRFCPYCKDWCDL